ncbi:hypothetical protein GOC31_27175 [Sinorhizobium meliloti]|nr:hypothetical protein [Sinorhizobium meliloti]MDX0252338.1 hypothetical protein [Sinorhizobium meliloti]
MRAVVSTAPMAGATPYAANDLEGRVPSNTYEANRDEVGESEGGGSEEEGSEADGSEEGEPAEGSDADVPEEEGSEERTDNNNGYRPPDDVYGIGYREWFEDRLGREPDTVPRLNLGLHYNEYFNEKLEVYSPEYKGSNSIYAGRNPGYTPDGFQTFKTIGPWTTQMYFYGYHTGKIAGAVLKRGAVILTFVPDRRAKVWAVAMMLAASRLPDGLGEVASAYGNIYDNRDVMSYNVRRLLQITPGSNKPFSPWPPLH